MKKLIAFLLAIVMILSLCACDSNEKRRDDDDDDDFDTSESEHGSNGLFFGEGKLEPVEEDDDETEEGDKYVLDQSVSIEKTKLYLQNDVSIIANELTFSYSGAKITFEFENKSKIPLEFAAEFVSVNGFMLNSGYLRCDVAAGKKAQDYYSISISDLELYNIETIADISLQFVIDDDSYSTKPLRTEILEIETSEKNNYKFITAGSGTKFPMADTVS